MLIIDIDSNVFDCTNKKLKTGRGKVPVKVKPVGGTGDWLMEEFSTFTSA